ncbi:MAG: DNA polymerase I [Tannerellaceae bacterium]|jgi:DNA polymerase-1|nr:DNA polymerase I [Tannerellaceae bacterium]
MKLFLIDGFSLIYRAYFAFIHSPRITSGGLNTSAVFGFLNILEEVLRKYNPTHIGVALDPPGPTFRHEAYASYKAQRNKTPEDIIGSVPILKKLLQAYRIPTFETPGFEADDVIGTLALQAAQEGFEVFMVTSDKDYTQLLRPHIYLCRPQSGGDYEILDAPKTLEKFGLSSAEQFIDLLALMGDASDNIPGCPGIGEKTASRLLQQFGSVEELLSQTHLVKGVLRYRIQQNADEIRFSRILATIRTDVPIQFEAEICRYQPANEKRLRELFSELEFHTFLNRLDKNKGGASQATLPFFAPVQVVSSPAATSRLPTEAVPTQNSYRTAESRQMQEELSELLTRQDRFAIAFHGEDEKSRLDRPRGVAFAFDEQEAWFVPLEGNAEEVTQTLKIFSSPLANPRIEKIGHDLKGHICYFRQQGICLQGLLFDTLIAHYLLHPELTHSKTYLFNTCLKYSLAPLQDISADTAESAGLLLRLRQHLSGCFDKDTAHVFHDIEMPLVYVLADMEYTGVTLNIETLHQSSLSLNSSLTSLQEEIFQMAGTSFNINSSRQIATLLEDHFHIHVAAKTKTGQVSTGEAVLDQLRDRHPVIGKILEYRQVKKLLSTYVEALPRLLRPETGKIHASFHQAVVSTGRLSSSNPNLQNIPVRNELGREIRKAFTADNGECVFFSADYSQIELRILAHLSRDLTLVESFHNGEDIHAATASKIFRVAVEEVTPEMRRKAKSANFGIIYGISPFGLSRALNISREESSKLITNYFASYPDVRKYLEQSLEQARKNGYVETILHRRTQVSNLNSANRAVRAAAERFVTNAPIQGSAADLIKLAMIAISRRFKEKGLQARMIMQVHDELNFNVPVKELDTVRAIVIYEMENAFPLEIPLVVDSGYGVNWLEAH